MSGLRRPPADPRDAAVCATPRDTPRGTRPVCAVVLPLFAVCLRSTALAGLVPCSCHHTTSQKAPVTTGKVRSLDSQSLPATQWHLLALELSISCRPQERLQAAAVTFLKLDAYESCGLHKYVRAVNTTASLHHSRSRFRSVPDRTVAQPLSLVALPIDRPMNGVLRRISCRRMSRGGGRGPSRVMTKSIAAMLGGRSFGVRQTCYSYVLDAPAPRARVLAGVDTEWS